MKAVHTITLSALALGALGTCLWLSRRSDPEPAVASSPPVVMTPEENEVTVRTDMEAAEVFRRAFWREPAADDRILHAERREWVSDENGVRLWQWFLAVEPSIDLSAWLREENPFGLSPLDRLAPPVNPETRPDWFPSDRNLADCEVSQAANGLLTLYRDRESGVLYATDAGRGFAPAHRGTPTGQGGGAYPDQELPTP